MVPARFLSLERMQRQQYLQLLFTAQLPRRERQLVHERRWRRRMVHNRSLSAMHPYKLGQLPFGIRLRGDCRGNLVRQHVRAGLVQFRWKHLSRSCVQFHEFFVLHELFLVPGSRRPMVPHQRGRRRRKQRLLQQPVPGLLFRQQLELFQPNRLHKRERQLVPYERRIWAMPNQHLSAMQPFLHQFLYYSIRVRGRVWKLVPGTTGMHVRHLSGLLGKPTMELQHPILVHQRGWRLANHAGWNGGLLHAGNREQLR